MNYEFESKKKKKKWKSHSFDFPLCRPFSTDGRIKFSELFDTVGQVSNGNRVFRTDVADSAKGVLLK